MATSKAQQKAVSKYETQNYDKALIRFPKGTRELVKNHAQQQGKSLNGYILELIEKDSGIEL